jgi:Mrp family chromosome partitioning ATPase
MSALDKAFIKAYHKDASPASAAPRARPAETPASQNASGCETPSAAPAMDSHNDQPGHRVDDAHAEPPAPHRAPHDPSASPPPPDAAPVSEAPQMRPSLLALTEPPAQPEAPQAFTPEWEVDRLAWPAICERLLESEARYFRSVGQRLKEATRDNHHVVMITGARRGEGRTTLALCLARCAAQAGIKVALVDADLGNPQLGSRLGIETPCSWLEAVLGKSPLKEAAVASLEDGLTLFPLTIGEDLAVPTADPRWNVVLQAIAMHFPLVIVDTGPLGSDGRHPFSTDADSLIDTAIVVRDLRNTSEERTLATAARLQRSGVHAVGIAENFYDLEPSE